MMFGAFPQRFAALTACCLTMLMAHPCAADMPPLGYVGPMLYVARTAEPATPSSIVLPPGTPQLGYVGPIPHTSSTPIVEAAAPIIAPIPESVAPSASAPVLPVAAAAAPTPSRHAPPPLGYTGPAPYIEPAQVASLSPPAPLTLPIGYVGEVSRSAPAAQQPIAANDRRADHPGETLISAKQMHTDSETGVTTATGQVEIVRADYILHADQVSYNQKTGVMMAEGHVALLTPTGEVEFADHQAITGDMKQAFATNIGILFPDNSRMAGNTAQRYDERYTVVNHAAYTACNICRTDPTEPPLWQLHANTITHDDVEHKIYYHDAVVDFAGVPVAYTPYLSSPDPTVKRLQGFLSPLPGYSPDIGGYLKTPYYFDIAPDKDATLTPTFSTTDKVQMAGQYRERFDKGDFRFDGSIVQADLVDDSGVDKGQHIRGDAFSTFRYDIDDTLRAGTDVQYASDKSYLHRYGISSIDQTTSRAYVENLQGRNYAVVNSYYFQDLRPGVDVSEPLVLPSATFSALGDPGQTLGGRWSFDGNTLITTRDNAGQAISQQGPDTRRLSMNGGWQRQLISDTGLETAVSGLFRTDSYWADNVVGPNTNTVYNNAVFTRQFEQANAIVRYPMGRSGDGYQQILEPIIAFTAAPDVRQIAKQPIEDSLDVEFDETNLFSPNRFTGSDLIEGGSRVTYGARNAVTTDSGGRLDVFAGESYDFTTNSAFPELSGLNGHASDYVGRIDFAPAKWLDANYGFRLSESDLSPQRQDASISAGTPLFRPSARYLEAYETDTTTGLIDQVKEVILNASSTFDKYWTLSGTHTQAFDPAPGPRNSGLALTYVDECFAAGVNLSRTYTDRADISSGTSISFHFYLKNLGGLHTDSVGNISFPAEFRETAQ